MALVFIFPTYHPYCYSSYYNRAAPGYDWREIAFAFEEQAGETCCHQKKHRVQSGSNHRVQGPIKIAFLQLNQYRPEEISVDVDREKITLHGQHRSEGEDGFANSEFKKIIKLPEGVDPATVTSRAIKHGSVLLLEGNKRIEQKAKADDNKFAVKLDLRGFNPQDIKVQLRGRELTITGKHKSEESGRYLSHDHSRRILLPNDADLGSVTSRLSKEGLLTIEASRDPALLPSDRSIDVTKEADEPQPEDEATTSGDAEEQN